MSEDKILQPITFENKWKQKWLEDKIYKTPEIESSETQDRIKKFYSLYSFPYPSGAGLHVGHVEGMVANDIVARYYRMKGYNVTLPMGWDSFGLPAENYAIKTGIHPNESTEQAVATFINQINNVGISVDWDKEVGAHRPDYYKWTQWIFLDLFKKGLAYKKTAPVNWCPKDQTVLANEQVIKKIKITNEKLNLSLDKYYSYLMGADDISDSDLEAIGVNIVDKEEKNRMLEIPGEKIEEYKNLIIEKLSNGFWNEYIGNEIVFIFKNKEGKIEELELNSENEKSICHYASEFTGDASFREKSVVDWLFDNEFYSKFPEIKQALIDSLKTRENIEVGVCERCDTEVVQKDMEQWFFKITDFAERLHNDLDSVDWPESTKIMQRNWIGRSEGTNLKFEIRSSKIQNLEDPKSDYIEVFTTRIDTIFGATFVVIAPEHSIINKLKSEIENFKEVEEYVNAAKNKTDLERQTEKEKTGVKVEGLYAINPFNNVKLPIYIGDYVLGNYGTGAIMAVPAHDERDNEFAQKHGVEIKEVIKGKHKNGELLTGYGELINSGKYTGLVSSEAIEKMQKWLEEEGIGRKETTYKLRDWLVSRQRYWGCPIPIIYSQKAKEEGYGIIPKESLNVLVLHGWASTSQDNWNPWLETELTKLGHNVFVPDLPNTMTPNFHEWMEYIEQNYKTLLENPEKLVVVGHSLGAYMATKLAEKYPIAKVVGVAASYAAEEEHYPEEIRIKYPEAVEALLRFYREGGKPNYKNLESENTEMVFIYSNDDPYLDENLQGIFRTAYPSAIFKDYEGRGHFGSKENCIQLDEILYFVNIKNNSEMPGIFPVTSSNLPVKLPTDVDFKPTGESPLAVSESFNEGVICPIFGTRAKREIDTMDTFVDSSWYYFRYTDPHNEMEFARSEKMNEWLPTDLYMIGTEHTVLHLLYSRFFTKFFYDQGYINFDEPFYKMRHMGLILGPDGRKMSKRWGNVINPDDEVQKFGADTVRMYEMFMGPLEDAKPWNNQAESGVFRFLSKVWELQYKVKSEEFGAIDEITGQDKSNVDQLRQVNKLIKKISDDIENLSFNTSVAKFMEFVNYLGKEQEISYDVWVIFLLLLAPFAPFITEELWNRLGREYSIHNQEWPIYDETLITDEIVKIAVQVNGKVRATVEVAFDSEEKDVLEAALENENVRKHLSGNPKKVIFVKNRIINLISK